MEEPLQTAIPTDYHGISFDEWLDIFLEYALVVAGQGEAEEAYDTLSAAADASVWYHSKPSSRQIHVCWFSQFIPSHGCIKRYANLNRSVCPSITRRGVSRE